MFTGIITQLGEVIAVERREGLVRIAVESGYAPGDIAVGASIAHNGCCLTVTAVEPCAKGARHFADIAAESLALTTLSELAPGAEVNLERSLRLGDELGGHMLAGHVDRVGAVLALDPDGPGQRMRFSAPPAIAPLIAVKGSIGVDGVSLTVNDVNENQFSVLVIPHTLSVTTLGRRRIGDRVNIEADLIARYVARMLRFGSIPG